MELYHNNINPFFFDTIKNNHKAGFPHLRKKKKKDYWEANSTTLWGTELSCFVYQSRSELRDYLILDEEIVAEKHDNHGYVTDSDM